MSYFPHRKFPCNECPWRLDAEPGRFPVSRYEALSVTSGNGVSIDAPMFGCHKGEPGTDADLACAGWLAVAGREHPAVRLAVALGRLPVEALEPGDNWPDLHGSYAALAEANGVAAKPARVPPTPVIEGDYRLNPQTGEVEAWSAKSVDGEWEYERIEDEVRPIWEARRTGTRPGVWYPSLLKARRGTASGSADRMLRRLAKEAVR